MGHWAPDKDSHLLGFGLRVKCLAPPTDLLVWGFLSGASETIILMSFEDDAYEHRSCKSILGKEQ